MGNNWVNKKSVVHFLSGRHFFAGLFLFLITCSHPCFPEDTVKIKIIAVNPSTTQSLKSTIAQYLPPEISPDDILDKTDLEIKYDTEKRAYLIRKEVELQPKESKTIEIRVRNVWVISPEEIDTAKTHLKQSMDALSKTKFAQTGQLLFDKANEVLTEIDENQTKPLGIMQRIEMYRVNMRQLEDIKNNALSLEAMRKLDEENKTGIRDVKYVITAENPASEQKTLNVRSELPRDMQAEDVLEKGNFKLVFDENKSLFALEMSDTLGPKEVKEYQIILRDIWYIPQSELDFLRVETEKLIPLFTSSAYEDFAVKQGEAIFAALKSINTLQDEVASSADLDERIRSHVLNQQREKFVRRKIKELQDLLSEVSLKPTENDLATQVRQLVKKLAEIKKLVVIAMGFHPKKSIVWMILLGIIIFLAVLTATFYNVWLKKLKQSDLKSNKEDGQGSEKAKGAGPEAKP